MVHHGNDPTSKRRNYLKTKVTFFHSQPNTDGDLKTEKNKHSQH